jgi:enoyl-CoA hydratase
MLSYERDGDVAVLRLDDGKANVIGPDAVAALDEALTRAEGEAGALLLVGREGKLSAGFDLSVMTSGVEPMRGLVRSGAELLLRLYASPLPTVTACTGHALAMGCLLLLATDTRIGAEGAFKIGLNEVAIGMGLPIFAVELARDRLTPPAFTAATTQGKVFSPDEAQAVGYLDQVVPAQQVEATARQAAHELSALRRGAVGHTKERARRATIDLIRSTLEGDMAETGMPDPR